MFIRDLRDSTGLTQKEFAERFDIPLSTLRKWEQGEASPAPYVVKMIASLLPSGNVGLEPIECRDGRTYYYSRAEKNLRDNRGNVIPVAADLDKVKRENLALYIQDLFESYYLVQEKFNRDCAMDQQESIIWE